MLDASVRSFIAAALVLCMTSCATAGSGAVLDPRLLEKARTQGPVLVIVTLRVPAGASTDVIQAAKQAVLTEIAATPHRVIRELKTLPQLVLEASEETLRVLGTSPRVLRIDESVPRPPTR